MPPDAPNSVTSRAILPDCTAAGPGVGTTLLQNPDPVIRCGWSESWVALSCSPLKGPQITPNS